MQFGFLKKTGTREAIFTLRMLGERYLQIQRDVYLYFIDYEKAFDKVQHEGIIQALNKHNFGKEYVQLIKNLYCNQNVAVQIGKETTNFKKIQRRVRQGCVLSPTSFNLYDELIFGTAKIEYQILESKLVLQESTILDMPTTLF